MKTVRNGIILNVEKFDDCVAIYRDLFGFEKLFEQQSGASGLACLEFGESCLMIETDGFAIPAGKSPKESPARLRFNVDDIEVARDWLDARGIEAKVNRYEWGSTIDLYDPDGNRVGIRDETTFRDRLEA
jgi:lactoylglutathione lyase